MRKHHHSHGGPPFARSRAVAYEKVARPVASKNFRRLPLYFSRMQLEVAKFVAVDRVPLPHLSSIGITRFKEFERGDYDGITYLCGRLGEIRMAAPCAMESFST